MAHYTSPLFTLYFRHSHGNYLNYQKYIWQWLNPSFYLYPFYEIKSVNYKKL